MKVDILLATYNGEKYLKEQLDSILNQTFKNFTLYISDDKSTDNTKKILKEYEKKDKRIKLFFQEKNLGYRKNFEFLCRQATAPYIMFADQDDIFEKDKVKLMLDEIKNNSYTLVYSDLKIVDKDLNIIYPSMIRYMRKEHQVKYSDYRAVNLDNVVTGCAMLTTKKVIEKALPIPDSIYVHDWWIALIATQLGPIKYLDIPLVNYRQHDKNSIGIKSQEQNEGSFENYRESVINFKKEQYQICTKRKNIFNKEYQDLIDIANLYFTEIDKKDISIIKRIKMHNKIYKSESLTRKIKVFLLFNFPHLAKPLYNLREELKK